MKLSRCSRWSMIWGAYFFVDPKLTTEQAIGQILQLIRERDQRLQELENRVYEIRQAQNGDGE